MSKNVFREHKKHSIFYDEGTDTFRVCGEGLDKGSFPTPRAAMKWIDKEVSKKNREKALDLKAFYSCNYRSDSYVEVKVTSLGDHESWILNSGCREKARNYELFAFTEENKFKISRLKEKVSQRETLDEEIKALEESLEPLVKEKKG